jgi:hypothetical protein
MANASVLSSGMGLGFPAITLEALKDTNNNNNMHLNDEQASWFGKRFVLLLSMEALAVA